MMDTPGDRSENNSKPASTNSRVGASELHPLMAAVPPNVVLELNHTNLTSSDSGKDSETLANLPLRGIDDGFLIPGSAGNGRGDGDSEQPSRPREREDRNNPENPEPSYPHNPDHPGIPAVPPVSGNIPRGRGGVDINVYAHKKTLAQGMMDLALLSANANQLRYVLDTGSDHPYFYVGLTLISTSIILQLAVGIGLILNSRYNIRHIRDIEKANNINNLTVLGIFLVTMMNVFISAFGVGDIASTPSIPSDSGPPDRIVDA